LNVGQIQLRAVGSSIASPVLSAESTANTSRLPRVSITASSSYGESFSGSQMSKERTGPAAQGYTRSHTDFQAEEARWRKKTLAITAPQEPEEVSLKVMMGHVVILGAKVKIVPIPVCQLLLKGLLTD
jgi:hypothetical protein